MSFQIKDFLSIVASMVNYMRGATSKITDYNVGSVARTMVEAPAIEIDQLYQQMLFGLRDAIPTATYPLLPRQFTIASSVTIGIPAFVLALAPSSGPWRPEGFLRSVVRFALPAGLTTDNPRHIAIAPQGAGAFADVNTPDTESTPSGNSVSLEQEMIKVSDTQAQFQAATNLYAKAIQMMKTAIGRTGM